MIWPLRKPEPEFVAAVDLGSNSFHMIVCRSDNCQLVVVDRLREMVRLAAGLDKDKNLTADARQRALDCLERFGQRLANLPQHCIRIVGTNTLRSAHNADDFIQQAEARLGHPIEIISGVEEARLIYLGVAHSIAADDSRRLVMDIGGGSTEFIIGESFNPLHMESLHMGCVSMSQRFFSNGKITAKQVKAADIAAQQELEVITSQFRKLNWETAIGASGTIRAAFKVTSAMQLDQHGLTRDALKSIINAMVECGHIDQLNLPGLADERRAVFPGGIIILYASFKALGIKRMEVSDGALREGLVHDLFGRIHHEDVRSNTVSALRQRYHVDLEHIERVKETAITCLDRVAHDWELDADDDYPFFLGWAVELFEIGLDISHSQYQKHSAYIIENSDLIGFSKQEQKILATLALAHRRKIPVKAFKELPKHRMQAAIRLTILLRLAILLHRSRDPEPLPEFSLKVQDKNIEIGFTESWFESHRLTEADLLQEAEYLKPTGYLLTINK